MNRVLGYIRRETVLFVQDGWFLFHRMESYARFCVSVMLIEATRSAVCSFYVTDKLIADFISGGMIYFSLAFFALPGLRRTHYATVAISGFQLLGALFLIYSSIRMSAILGESVGPTGGDNLGMVIWLVLLPNIVVFGVFLPCTIRQSTRDFFQRRWGQFLLAIIKHKTVRAAIESEELTDSTDTGCS